MSEDELRKRLRTSAVEGPAAQLPGFAAIEARLELERYCERRYRVEAQLWRVTAALNCAVGIAVGALLLWWIP